MTFTILDFVMIAGVLLIIGGLLLTPVKEDKTEPPFIVVGQIGRHVAVITALGNLYKFQVECYSGKLEKGWLIGVIHPTGELVRYRVLEDSVKLDGNTLTVKCALLQDIK